MHVTSSSWSFDSSFNSKFVNLWFNCPTYYAFRDSAWARSIINDVYYICLSYTSCFSHKATRLWEKVSKIIFRMKLLIIQWVHLIYVDYTPLPRVFNTAIIYLRLINQYASPLRILMHTLTSMYMCTHPIH